ncbi:hypothetical protein [Telmatospirillum sp. J64-1]|uniref:hypothetical protein n=1 Tax=Telmatospirillum sp. J64-1 TaxID=2502183 RepID=UPI00115EE923|nr:hypothetical protein [Telmatospirillum sp. J64-1]
MPVLYVARSVKLSKWAADVGLGKHVYKVGCVEDAPAEMVKSADWAGESDWTLVKKQEVEEALTEEEVIERLGRKEKMVDPNLYPRIKGLQGLFKVKQANVENHILVSRALSGGPTPDLKVKPADFATYLINNARK